MSSWLDCDTCTSVLKLISYYKYSSITVKKQCIDIIFCFFFLIFLCMTVIYQIVMYYQKCASKATQYIHLYSKSGSYPSYSQELTVQFSVYQLRSPFSVSTCQYRKRYEKIWPETIYLYNSLQQNNWITLHKIPANQETGDLLTQIYMLKKNKKTLMVN